MDEHAKAPWTKQVLDHLRSVHDAAAISQHAHYAIATRMARFNIWFGVPVVVLTTLVGTSVFATLQQDVRTSLRILVGVVSVLAAVLASLQTFLRFQERSEKHRASAELWSQIRRETERTLALHPDYLAERSDPKSYLDSLGEKLDRVAGMSPEIGETDIQKARASLLQSGQLMKGHARHEADPAVPAAPVLP